MLIQCPNRMLPYGRDKLRPKKIDATDTKLDQDKLLDNRLQKESQTEDQPFAISDYQDQLDLLYI